MSDRDELERRAIEALRRSHLDRYGSEAVDEDWVRCQPDLMLSKIIAANRGGWE